MTRAGFEYVLDKHARAAAETCPSLRGRSVSPHQLRHSCAVIMFQATHDIRKVALWLGHADIRTTEVYLRMDATEKLEAVEAVIPPELRRGRFKAPDALIASLLEDAPRRRRDEIGAAMVTILLGSASSRHSARPDGPTCRVLPFDHAMRTGFTSSRAGRGGG